MREGLEAFDSKMGQISEKMEELIKLERQARDLVNLLKNEMVKDVQEVKLPGVTITETPSGGCFAIVKFGELKLDNWSPRTYIPREQAKAVVEELENCTTVDGICKRVGKMLEKGFIGDRTDDRVYLNEYTLKAIQNSDIGIYVMAHGYAPNHQDLKKKLASARGKDKKDWE